MDCPQLLIISIDALLHADLADCSRLPHIASIIAEGSMVESMHSIYPSLTHPAHASIISGRPPSQTGVWSNTHFRPFAKSVRWFNRLAEVRCPTILHQAKERGLSTAACRWPLTAEGWPTIDYLVPEVTGDEIEHSGMECLLKASCSPSVWPLVAEHMHLLDGKRQPNEDYFSTALAAAIIERHRPNLVLTHPACVDSARHHTGLFSEAVDQALVHVDAMVGQLIASGPTNIIILGDHGHLPVDRAIALNVRLRDAGLITAAEDGSILSFDAWAHANGLSAHLYLADRTDRALHRRVELLLRGWMEEGDSGIGAIFTTALAKQRYGLDGPFSFVVEGDGHSEFVDDVLAVAAHPYKSPRSGHGHLPSLGHQPPLLCVGPAFKSQIRLSRGSILDVAPLAAAVLGFGDGGPLGTLLR